MRYFALGVVAVSVLGTSCASTSPSPTTGLTGTVVRGPITPVCRIDVPCDAPFSAGFSARRGERDVARFRSDSAGQFTVFLEAGAYTIVPDADAPLLGATSQAKSVNVGDTGLTTVHLTFDTGIR